MKLIPALAFALSCVACATPAPRAPAHVPAPARLEPKPVEFFTSPDQVPYAYRELELVTVVGWGRDHDEMVRELRERARGLGADGVILLISQDTEECGLDYSRALCTRDSVLMRGIAIVDDEN